MTNKEKFMRLVSDEKTSTLNDVKKRVKDGAMLRESQKIALKILFRLDELKWSQRKLASEMSVTPQFVNKIVMGKENLTLETQIKIQNILDIPILASYYIDKQKKLVDDLILTLEKEEKYAPITSPINTNYKAGKVIKMTVDYPKKTTSLKAM